MSESPKSSFMGERDRLLSALFLTSGVLAAVLAVYYYALFSTLQNPITHVISPATDYFSYVQYYYQTEANFQVCWRLSVVALALSSFCFAFRSIKDSTALEPFRWFGALLRNRSQKFKAIVFAVPLVLLEAGLFLYGGLMGLARYNFAFSLDVREEPIIRALVMGPLGPLGIATSAEQDYYFLALFVASLAAAFYRFGSIRRVFQIGALAIVPLPSLIYLFDRIEFNTFFASVAYGSGLPWFSNALLLYLSVAVLAIATAYPMVARLASRALHYTATR